MSFSEAARSTSSTAYRSTSHARSSLTSRPRRAPTLQVPLEGASIPRSGGRSGGRSGAIGGENARPRCVGTHVGARVVVQIRVQIRVGVGMCVGMRVGALEGPRTRNGERRSPSRARFGGIFGVTEIGRIFGVTKIGGIFGGVGSVGSFRRLGSGGFPRGLEGCKIVEIVEIGGVPSAAGVSTFHRNSRNTPDYSTGRKASEPRHRWAWRTKRGENRRVPTRYPVSLFPLFRPFPFRSRFPRGT